MDQELISTLYFIGMAGLAVVGCIGWMVHQHEAKVALGRVEKLNRLLKLEEDKYHEVAKMFETHINIKKRQQVLLANDAHECMQDLEGMFQYRTTGDECIGYVEGPRCGTKKLAAKGFAYMLGFEKL